MFWKGLERFRRRTILLSLDPGAAALRTWPDISMGFNPYLVQCPFLQSLKHIAGGFSRDVSHLMALLFFSWRCLVGQRVAHNVPMATGSRRCKPTHLDAGRREAEQVHILRRGGWGCGCGGQKSGSVMAHITNSKPPSHYVTVLDKVHNHVWNVRVCKVCNCVTEMTPICPGDKRQFQDRWERKHVCASGRKTGVSHVYRGNVCVARIQFTPAFWHKLQA